MYGYSPLVTIQRGFYHLLSRFIMINLKRPPRDEFIEIGKRMFIGKEGIDPTIALCIASQVYEKKKILL